MHVTTLADDFYRFDEQTRVLFGERTKKVYRLGDAVRVQVIRVDLDRRQVELGIEDVLAAVRQDERARGPRRSRAGHRATGDGPADEGGQGPPGPARARRPQAAVSPVRSVIVGTAGHIDHGKSTLVKALTGTDPDRLKEEKARGITIELGFAHVELGDGVTVSFVDVPGHERFVRTMLAGVGGIDAVLLVVAADEGVMPQTREHFDICRLLQVRHGAIALTKVDAADAEMVALATLDVRELVAGSFLEGAPIVPVSAATGDGLDQLRTVLSALATAAPRRDADGAARLPVDRVFSMRGFGTVVTGTLVSGRVGVEDELDVLPAGRHTKVRGLHVHGRPRTSAAAGERIAVNLAGLEVR